MERQNYGQDLAWRVLQGITEETEGERKTPFGLLPKTHYIPRIRWARRVVVVRMEGLNKTHIKRVKALKTEITASAGLHEEKQVRITHDGRAVVIEIPKVDKFKEGVSVEDLLKRRWRNGPIATLGLGLQDDPVRVNFSDPLVAHALISGGTGSGKTNTQKLMAWGLCRGNSPHDAKMFIFDVSKRGLDWHGFEQSINLAAPPIYNLETASQVMTWLAQEIGLRAAARSWPHRLFVVIDELGDLVESSDEISKNLSTIATLGRGVDIHIIAATQYPQISILKDPKLKRNLTTRLCGKVDDSASAHNALGQPKSGAEFLGGLGDFLLLPVQDATLSRLTVAELKDKHIETLERGNIADITLPDAHAVLNNPPEPVYQASPTIQYPDAEQMAVAIFERPEIGIQNFREKMGIKGTKEAARIIKYADKIRKFALKGGYKCL